MTFENRLKESARAWFHSGAPFAPHGNSKRYGIDCVNLAHAIYTESGLQLPEIPRRYFMDASRHEAVGILTEWIEGSGKFQPLELAESYPVGTLLCTTIGHAPYHVAVVIDDVHAIHSIRRAGVCCVAYRTEFEQITHAYEPIL